MRHTVSHRNHVSGRLSAGPFLLFCLLLAIWAGSGCAPLQEEKPPLSPERAESTWAAFWSGQERLASLPGASLQGSLNIFTPEQKRRITFELWGNPPTPLRLHLRAGLGTTISIWEIRRDRVLVFFPRNNRAYIAKNTAQATAAMGLRLPFSLSGMTRLLTGSWQGLLWREYDRFEVLPGEGYAFYPQGKRRIARVVLDRKARIVALSGNRPHSWRLKRKDLTTREGHVLSQRMELSTERDEELILRIKEFEPRDLPWPEADLRLSLPPDTMVRPLPSSEPGNEDH
jgi:outer membrane biogenesis lipoprotein LolB